MVAFPDILRALWSTWADKSVADPIYQAYKKRMEELQSPNAQTFRDQAWRVSSLSQKDWEDRFSMRSSLETWAWSLEDLERMRMSWAENKASVWRNLDNYLKEERTNNEAIQRGIVENAATQQALWQAAVTRAWMPVQASWSWNAQVQSDTLQKVSQQQTLSSDKQLQALDSMERLILSIDAQQAANDVNYRNQALGAIQQYELARKDFETKVKWTNPDATVNSKNADAVSEKVASLWISLDQPRNTTKSTSWNKSVEVKLDPKQVTTDYEVWDNVNKWLQYWQEWSDKIIRDRAEAEKKATTPTWSWYVSPMVKNPTDVNVAAVFPNAVPATQNNNVARRKEVESAITSLRSQIQQIETRMNNMWYSDEKLWLELQRKQKELQSFNNELYLLNK
jgi:hypothetical protein